MKNINTDSEKELISKSGWTESNLQTNQTNRTGFSTTRVDLIKENQESIVNFNQGNLKSSTNDLTHENTLSARA